MKATINGITVEGTPQEMMELIQISQKLRRGPLEQLHDNDWKGYYIIDPSCKKSMWGTSVMDKVTPMTPEQIKWAMKTWANDPD